MGRHKHCPSSAHDAPVCGHWVEVCSLSKVLLHASQRRPCHTVVRAYDAAPYFACKTEVTQQSLTMGVGVQPVHRVSLLEEVRYAFHLVGSEATCCLQGGHAHAAGLEAFVAAAPQGQPAQTLSGQLDVRHYVKLHDAIFCLEREQCLAAFPQVRPPSSSNHTSALFSHCIRLVQASGDRPVETRLEHLSCCLTSQGHGAGRAGHTACSSGMLGGGCAGEPCHCRAASLTTVLLLHVRNRQNKQVCG
jgi:hypothetical protein